MSESHVRTLDIEIYSEEIKDDWKQGKYLVHGFSDILWTDDLDDAMSFLKESIKELEESIKQPKQEGK